MKKILLLVVGAACALLVAAAPAAANHKWSKYHWARTTTSETVLLVLSEGTGVSAWSSNQVLADWNGSSPLNGNGTPVVRVEGGASGVDVTAESGNYGATGWVGVAQIGIGSGNHIVSGTIKLNTYYGIAGSQMRSTYCMEVGHIFGLGHNDEGRRGGLPDNTCMNEDRWEVSPNSHDTQQLASIYNHGDGYSTSKTRHAPTGQATIHRVPLSVAAAFR